MPEGFWLSALPRTRDEVQGIESLFKPDRRRVYLGKDSTEAGVKSAPLRRYKRLHCATHSLVYERNTPRSTVVLTLDKYRQEDGFLELDEITELDLAAT